MKTLRIAFASAAVALASVALSAKETADYTSLVNPLMGTESTFELSTGNTYPAIALPWGMNFWTPQTGKNGDGRQYQYTASWRSTRRNAPHGSATRGRKPFPITIRYIWPTMTLWPK